MQHEQKQPHEINLGPQSLSRAERKKIEKLQRNINKREKKRSEDAAKQIQEQQVRRSAYLQLLEKQALKGDQSAVVALIQDYEPVVRKHAVSMIVVGMVRQEALKTAPKVTGLPV